MIKNTDGSEYRTSGEHKLFDPKSSDHDLFNTWDEESIRIGGSPIYYYEVFIQSGTVDPIYWEDRGKIFSNHPIELYAVYEPIQSQNALGAFGIDSPDEMMFELNYQAVLKAIGHPPKIGSRIHSPHLREDWVIIQRNLGEFKAWGALRLQLMCGRFQESSTTGEGRVADTHPDTDFKIV